TAVTDKGLKILSPLVLKYLTLPEQAQTDLGLVNYLAALQRPDELDLAGWHLTAKGLQKIGELKTLKSLSLRGTGATDDTLEMLGRLAKLDVLSFSAPRVSVQGVRCLAKAPKLRCLRLPSSFSEKDVRSLRPVFPGVPLLRGD